MDFINAAHYDSAGSTTAVVNKPTNTADNDIMFALIRRNIIAEPTTVPTGWTLIGNREDATYNQEYWLYWKLAASEGANYTWEWADAARICATIVTYRDGFNTADPIDVVSNTPYVDNNTTVRSATMTVSAANSPLVNFANGYGGSEITFTKPSMPTTDWVENIDFGSVDSRCWREICSMVWTGSGATGDIDATASLSLDAKHGFAVGLNPAAGGQPSGGGPADDRFRFRQSCLIMTASNAIAARRGNCGGYPTWHPSTGILNPALDAQDDNNSRMIN